MIVGAWGGSFVQFPDLLDILGDVTVQNAKGLTDLIVDDHDNFYAATFTLDGNQLNTSYFGSPLGTIAYDDAELASLTIHGGTGHNLSWFVVGNTFLVSNTSASLPITIDSGTGPDTIALDTVLGKIDLIDVLADDVVPFPDAPLLEHLVYYPVFPGPGGFEIDDKNLKTQEVHVYQFDVPVAGLLTVDVASLDFDSRVDLVNTPSYLINKGLSLGGGGLLASSDDGPLGNPHIQIYVEKGTYYVQVAASPADPDGSGLYDLAVVFNPFPFALNPLEEAGANEPVLVEVGINPRKSSTATSTATATGTWPSPASAAAKFGYCRQRRRQLSGSDQDGRFRPGAPPGPGAAGSTFNGDFRLDIMVWNGDTDPSTTVHVLLARATAPSRRACSGNWRKLRGLSRSVSAPAFRTTLSGTSTGTATRSLRWR